MPKPRDRARFRREPEEVIASTSPATGEFLGSVRVNTPDEVRAAVARAREAAASWAAKSFEERAQYLKRANDYIFDNLEAIADIISRENGKPRTEAKITDLLPAIYHNIHVARHGARVLADRPVSMPLWNLTGKSSYLRRIPWGVLGIISPWNYPFGIPMTQITMALAAGNTVVLKPSSSTALVGEKIRQVWESTGLPEGVVNVVQGPGRLGELFIEESVDRLIFTGSAPIGRHLAKLAAEKLIPITLELGGKDPAIVVADANLEAATSGVLWGAMANAGQTCAAIERVYVERAIFAEFVDLIVNKAKQLRVGADRSLDADVGAITTRSQLELIDRQVREAVAAGAKVEVGGHIVEDCCGDFYAPTILTNVTPEMAVVREETFGPVLPIIPFDTIDEAVRLANDSRFALSASVWTNDRAKGKQVAERLIAGTITVNDSLYSYALAETPWGGFKESGIGKTHGEEGLLEMTRAVHISTDALPRLKKPWWCPYDERLRDALGDVLNLLAGRRLLGSLADAARRLPLRGKL
jgi:succinate-semialdehyde dehydrogenase/glutarate-semialdehyde dehydrogenase